MENEGFTIIVREGGTFFFDEDGNAIADITNTPDVPPVAEDEGE